MRKRLTHLNEEFFLKPLNYLKMYLRVVRWVRQVLEGRIKGFEYTNYFLVFYGLRIMMYSKHQAN